MTAQTTFTVDTRGPGLSEITGQVSAWLPPRSGLLTLFLRHTSASLLVQENADPDVRRDIEAFLRRLVPPASDPAMRYLTHTAEGPDDMPGHLRAMLLPVSLSIPVRDGAMRLGTWQGIYVVEHRNAPHRREVAAHFLPDARG